MKKFIFPSKISENRKKPVIGHFFQIDRLHLKTIFSYAYF